jgi:hypothetical protein
MDFAIREEVMMMHWGGFDCRARNTALTRKSAQGVEYSEVLLLKQRQRAIGSHVSMRARLRHASHSIAPTTAFRSAVLTATVSEAYTMSAHLFCT